MKKDESGKTKKPFVQRRFAALAVVVLNVLLLATAAMLYGRYVFVYQERLREENLGNIANLNQSSAINATALIDSWSVKLEDIVQYIGRHDSTRDAALRMIEDSNSSADRQFELIADDYTGFLARRDESGAFIPLSYEKSSYAELQKAFDDVSDSAYSDVCFTPEFTDGATAQKYFAIYRHLPLVSDGGGQDIYTLLLATKASDILAVLNSQNGFEGQSTVLIDATGNYIVSSGDFKSTNFFQYLYVYNDLTLDQRNAITRELDDNGSGELYYKNAAGLDCVFRYEQIAPTNWYCVTSVPLSSFRTPVFNVNYAIYAVLSLILLLLIDIAWQRLTNRQLRVSMLREKEASNAKTDFLSRMSHDIRTPLNGIIGLATLANDEPNPPRTKEYLANIKVSGQFLTGLVNDILDMSKVESGKVELNPEPYSTLDLARYVDAVITPLCNDKGLEFRITPTNDTQPVLLDRLRFNQIMFNLLSNAVKYTPAGGLVELFWTSEPLPDDRIALHFTVRDNGIGMSEEFQKHMFESFSQEHASTAVTGAGLGLSIVNSLVRLMHGSIDVTSKQGVGSSFTVHLEAALSHENAAVAEQARQATLEGRRVLLCEDNQINTLVAQRMLEKWGMTVDTAENGREGLDKFSASPPDTYDAILMDVMMPELNGLDATRAIRALPRPDAAVVPIVAMTANAYASDVKNCMDAGMNAHMGKPIDRAQLHELLCALIKD